jgi:hypothetical protein
VEQDAQMSKEEFEYVTIITFYVYYYFEFLQDFMPLITRILPHSAWFLNETGRNNPYQFDLDPATMREVADMTEKLGDYGGGERDGGMWTLARMITTSVNSGKDAASVLRLEAGEIHHDLNPTDGPVRRRRPSRQFD